jgi:hypothetical protein
MSPWSGGAPDWRRTAVLALVFAALGFLALRPLCDAAVATHHGAADACCAVAEDGTFVKSTDPLASAKPGSGGAIALAAAALFAFGTLFLMPRMRVPERAPPPRSYYLRSARIQR